MTGTLIDAIVQVLSDEEAQALTVIENLQREGLTPFEDILKALTVDDIHLQDEQILPAVYVSLQAAASTWENDIDEGEWWKEYDKACELYLTNYESFMLNMVKFFIEKDFLKQLSYDKAGTLDSIDRSKMDKMAAYLKIDLTDIDAKFKEEITEPKAWDLLNADGTPKKKVKKAA